MKLSEKKCVPCEGGVRALEKEEILKYLREISGWEAEQFKKIRKDFIFHNFKEAMSFVNRAAELAEEEGHHPDIRISYNNVRLELWTHAAGGLTENDFILAAKIDNLGA